MLLKIVNPVIALSVTGVHAWTDCSRTCYKEGTKVRNRQVQLKEICGGSCALPLVDSKQCKNKYSPLNCQFAQWTKWAAKCTCQDICGGGRSDDPCMACYRVRHKIADAECGGYFESKTVDVRCEEKCKKKDCKPTEWELWEHCILLYMKM